MNPAKVRSLHSIACRRGSSLFLVCALLVIPLAGAAQIPQLAEVVMTGLERWLLRDVAAERTPANLIPRRAVGAGAAADAAEAFALRARFCVRPLQATACNFRNAASAREAAASALGPRYRLRSTNNPSLFEVLDSANNLINVIEVLDRQTHKEIDDMPIFMPSIEQAQEEFEYEVACGPGFAPNPYSKSPRGFGDWSCSNGGSYYNAAGACQPGSPGWRVWRIKGSRLQSAQACPAS